MASGTAQSTGSPSAQDRFDAFQQGHKPLAFPLAVLKKFGEDSGGNLAALLAYYGFFSLFPLLLVFVTILGYVLHGDPHLENEVAHGTLARFPFIGTQLRGRSLHGSAIALIVGVLLSLWSGLAVTNASQQALDRVWAVPKKDRASFVQSRLRGVALLVSLGILFIVSTAVTNAVGNGLGGAVGKIGGYVVSYLVNCALFFAAYRWMTSGDIPSRRLLLGTLIAAFGWTILQALQGLVLNRLHNNAYGQFATIITALLWLHLGAQIFVYSAEINVVAERKLWPRSFFGPPTEQADRDALTAMAKIEEQHESQRIDVDFSKADRSE